MITSIFEKIVVCPADVELLHLFKSVIATKWAKTWLLHYNPDKYESIMLATEKSSSVPYISYVQPVTE